MSAATTERPNDGVTDKALESAGAELKEALDALPDAVKNDVMQEMMRGLAEVEVTGDPKRMLRIANRLIVSHRLHAQADYEADSVQADKFTGSETVDLGEYLGERGYR